jgi:hypothetical protein
MIGRKREVDVSIRSRAGTTDLLVIIEAASGTSASGPLREFLHTSLCLGS